MLAVICTASLVADSLEERLSYPPPRSPRGQTCGHLQWGHQEEAVHSPGPCFSYLPFCHTIPGYVSFWKKKKERKKKNGDQPEPLTAFPSRSLRTLPGALVTAVYCAVRGGVRFMILNKCLPGLGISRALSRGSTNRFFFFPGVSRVCGLVERCRPSPPCLSTWMKIRIGMLR